MARRKQEACPVPQTTEEAIALIGEYVDGERYVVGVALRTDHVIARAKEARDSILAEVEAQQKPRFAALKAWWEAGGYKVGGRSAELAGATIGIRLTPPKLKMPKGMKIDAVINALRVLPARMGYAVLRTKYEIDKQQIIKLLRKPPENDGLPLALVAKGFAVEQRDEFYIDAGIDTDALRKEICG